MKILVSSTLALSLSLAIGAAQAEELSGTLKKVADNGDNPGLSRCLGAFLLPWR